MTGLSAPSENELPSIAAIVVTFHSGTVLKECLYALCANHGVTEIIIVNNGNTDDVVDWLANFECPEGQCRIELITGHGNIGFAAGVNLGAKAATGECLLIINPDAVLRAGSLPELELARQSGASPCLVGGKLFYLSGKEQRGGRRELLTPARALVSFTGLSKLEKLVPAFRNLHREHDPEPDGPVPMPVVSGALCYMSAKDYWAVDGFDEGYFLHVEDIDLCRRVGENGGQVIYTPNAGALHYGSTSQVSASFVEWNKAKGLSRYFKINANGPGERLFANVSLYLFAGLLVGRSSAIRAAWQLRRSLQLFIWKLTRTK